MNTTPAPTTTDLRDLELGTIAPDPGQPRKRFEKNALAELASCRSLAVCTGWGFREFLGGTTDD